MKKFFLSLALFATALVAGAQTEPTLQAKSIYDVDQDGKVGVQDVPALVKGLLGESEDKTAVDTQSLLEVLNKIWSELSELKSKVSAYEKRFAGIEDNLGVERHEYVDLGLPSKTLWATCNIGAKKPEDAGLYFAWGETTGYSGETDGVDLETSYFKQATTDGRSFDWASYKWCKGSSTSMTKYCKSSYYGTVDNITELLPEDDAATANWGSEWCMPTTEQQDELRNTSYCTWKWDETKKGYTVTSVSNGNSIFLPAAGFRNDGYLIDVGSYGNYWSRTLYSGLSYRAYYLSFYSSNVRRCYNSRFFGFPVRPVLCAQK